jgi:hypothetical protein
MKRNPIFVLAVSAVITLSSATIAFAANDNGKSLGKSNSGTPGGNFLTFDTVLTDSSSGQDFTVNLRAFESPDFAGVGAAAVEIVAAGGGITACTTHGGAADIDFSNLANSVLPYEDNQCGLAGRVHVQVDGCMVEASAHGYLHSDWPHVSFMGDTTIDFSYNANSGNLDIRMYTPKEQIHLQGSLEGNMILSTCQ